MGLTVSSLELKPTSVESVGLHPIENRLAMVKAVSNLATCMVTGISARSMPIKQERYGFRMKNRSLGSSLSSGV